MTILDKFRFMFSKKTMTASDWKKGMILSDYGLDGGVSTPFSQSTIVYVAASRISENLPQAPLEFYNQKSKTKLTIDSPIVRLFNRPNEHHTYFTFFEELTLYLALYGETFVWMGESMGQRAGTSTLPGQLVVLNPSRMQHVTKEGRLIGWIFDAGYKRVPIPPEDVLHVKFPNPYVPLRGLAPIDSVKVDVDSDYMAGKFAKAFFQNSANPSLVFTLPEDDESSTEQRKEFVKEWEKLRRGSAKQYKVALLNAGMDVKKTGLTQEEMDYVKQREFSMERILAVYGVPPPMAGFYEQATYGNVRTAKKIFWNETIKTYARRYESAINNFFLPIYAPGIVCKFNFSEIDELKHDAKETAELVKIYAGHGVPMNVLIEAFELPFEPQEGLDVGFQPMTMLPVGTNFLELQQGGKVDEGKQLVNVTPNIFDTKDQLALKYWDKKIDEVKVKRVTENFSKNLHNYFYRQREKLLKKMTKDTKGIDNTFWSQENDRLEAKFEPIYAELTEISTKSADKVKDGLKSINVFNRMIVDKKIKENTETDQLMNDIRKIYGNFDKKMGEMEDSRINLIAKSEIGYFLEQKDDRRLQDD